MSKVNNDGGLCLHYILKFHISPTSAVPLMLDLKEEPPFWRPAEIDSGEKHTSRSKKKKKKALFKKRLLKLTIPVGLI